MSCLNQGNLQLNLLTLKWQTTELYKKRSFSSFLISYGYRDENTFFKKLVNNAVSN